MLRKVCGSKRDKVTGDWRKLHNDELCDMYSSPSIICALKWRRMRWVGHVAQTGKRGMQTGFWQGNLKERDKLEDQRADGLGNIKMGVEEVRWKGMSLSHSV